MITIINPQRHIAFFRVVILLFTISCPLFTNAENRELSQEEIQQKIDSLMKEISEYQETLKSSSEEKRSIEKSLEENEKKIGDLIKKIEMTEGNIQKKEKKIGELGYKEQELMKSKDEQKELITHHIKSAYMLGKQEYLKLLLNQEDPHQISRMLTYYDYMNKERIGQIEKFTLTIDELAQVRESLTLAKNQLYTQRSLLEEQHHSLTKTQTKRQESLDELNEIIAATNSEIEEKLSNRQRLESLLDKITASIANLPTPEEILPFGDMKGKLQLPIQGNITEKYGDLRNEGKLKWNGLYISASRGTPVHAVHYGRIVFADWLRGFGLLMIISHGEGYMSLYGHNQLLYKEAGDWISAGELIAKAGDSGGQQSTGLYFEIRQEGKPLDPLLWCSTGKGSTV